MTYTLLKSTDVGLSFSGEIHFYRASSGKKLRSIWWCLTAFKAIEVGANGKPISDFLLVFHRNYIPVFYCFQDVTIY